jgi:Fic family protein
VNWDVINKARAGVGVVGAPRQPGGFTTREYAKRYKLAVQTAESQIAGMLDKGLLERISAKVADDNGRMRATFVYYPKVKK